MKLYVKNVKSCSECPACDFGVKAWYCKIACRPIYLNNTAEVKDDPQFTVKDWCPLEDAKE